ncbi:MAG: aminoacetone oxidase family FAD-binding enzyme [Pseudobutyrivibrio ruminis]|uniref:aminoacetone oxidase family FAD-binding enzyme n=1 Tax=Pseudobutyrivibrio ruminis TaxID=46206 RepID=UPI0026F1CA8C|nr:aminoacetone oxidase family FAD-binding enzyme [Pseudobutyrivibrio ruminis]MBE5914833.1 aminoacetone oxidase family FAD-binding enzyme [Pseudobutyrivibrio ruminis]
MNTDEKVYDVCIIGAGFSGLVLAIKLARAGLLVCLVELNRMVGRRILSTGNGRCNFTNSRMGAQYYYSNHSLDFISDNHNDLRQFLNELGVYDKDLDGYYYPITNQAKTVREALENEISFLGIDVLLDNRVTEVSKADLFKVTTARTIVNAKKVCVASGGLAAATLGSSKIGYKIAQSFKMKTTKLSPALVGVKSSSQCLKELAGVRATGVVSYKDYSCEGEIQFNKDSVSGYPIMCISRFIGFDELDKKLSDIRIDFIPYLSAEQLKEELNKRFNRNPKATILTALVGFCNEKAIEQIVSYSRIYGDTTVDRLDEEDIDNLVYFFKNFSIPVDGTKGFDSAQVTAGGVDLSEIDTSSMESLKCKGLYFTGEVLDVDGICGGYNLNWAYTSADIASKSIIKELQ